MRAEGYVQFWLKTFAHITSLWYRVIRKCYRYAMHAECCVAVDVGTQ